MRSAKRAWCARTLLGSLIVRPLLAVIALVPTSCIATSNPVFQEPDDCPPSFQTDKSIPSYRHLFAVDTTVIPLEFDGSVPLRSCALAKVYKGRIFLDGKLYGEIDIPPTGQALRDTTAVTVSLFGLVDGCHTVELLATTAFAPDTTLRTPEKQDDIASTIWYLDIEQPGTPGLPPTACE